MKLYPMHVMAKSISWYVSMRLPSCQELGYVSMDEIDHVRGALGLKVEMDKFWEPCPLYEITSGRRK